MTDNELLILAPAAALEKLVRGLCGQVPIVVFVSAASAAGLKVYTDPASGCVALAPAKDRAA